MNGALVAYDQYREDAGWTRYLALHRHGGIEVVVGHLAYEVSGVRVFPLRLIVAFTRAASAITVAGVVRLSSRE